MKPTTKLRNVTATSLMFLLTTGLSACGGSGKTDSTTVLTEAPAAETTDPVTTVAAVTPESVPAAAAAPAAKGTGEVNLYNWTDYIDPVVLKDFEKDTGIKVVLSTYDSNETLLGKLQAGGTGYDVIVPSDYMVKQMIELGLLQEVKPGSFENGKNIKPAFLDVYFDKGRNYTAPYMYGTTGINVDTSVVTTPPKSWAEFFAVPKGAEGKLGILNDQVEVIHAALRATGAKPCSENVGDYEKVKTLLAAFKPKVQVINSDGVIDRMGSGEQVMHMQWNGATHRSKLQKKTLTYVYPSDGLTLWQDNFAIPKGAKNVDNAKTFINWMMDPAHIGKATNFVGYDNGITGSDAFFDQALKDDPAVVATPENAALATPVEACSTKAVDLYDKIWTGFKS
jgi:spermidine/putrescine transport system substrate-binding protein